MLRRLVPAVLLALVAAPSLATTLKPFALVNRTTLRFELVEIRRTGTETWRTMMTGPDVGARQTADAGGGEDCAFDLRVRMSGGVTALWERLNLCEVSVLTLYRNPTTGETWADYE